MTLKKTAITLAAVFLMEILFANPYLYTADEWSKVVIKKAFISRQTAIDFRDANSAPEFGWHLRYRNRFVTGTGNLYGTLYGPTPDIGTLRLMLVERDVFNDDIVGGVNLKKGQKKYTVTANGDYVEIARIPFFPDGRSGKNGKADGAETAGKDYSDSVSFLQGDYTDYVKLPEGNSAILILAGNGIGKVDSTAEDISIYPLRRILNRVFIAASEKGGLPVRIRGKVGRGRLSYRIMVARGPNTFTVLFNKAMKFLNRIQGNMSNFYFRDISRAFLYWDKDKTLEMCKRPNGNIRSSRFTRFCSIVEKDKRWVKD